MQKELEQLGLSDKEAKTYLASLELGPASAQEIAKKSGLKRPTTYFAIEGLIKKGLMSSFEEGKKQHFSAESPERIISLIAAQKRKAQALEEDLQRILPDLNKLFNLTGEKPGVRFFEGKAGLRSIQEDLFRSKCKSIDEFVPMDEAYKIFPPALKDHRLKLKNKFSKIPRRVIYFSSKGKFLPEKEGSMQARFISKNKFPFSGELVLYNNKAAIVTYKGKLMGVIIESREITDTLKAVFSLAWTSLEK